ncbi:MAG: hypothetical protein J1F38_09415 [Muribaculaceae bacterium]|nr:hypothetical protein [Muribaculaceae bacterium]
MKAESLKSGDLLFLSEENSAFSNAIVESTAQNDSIKLIHVGIIEIVDDEPYLIEASPSNGVREIPIRDFLQDNKEKIFVRRIKFEFPVEQAITRAKSHIGEPYDWWYLPDNNKMYCSELVYESFLDANGNRIFNSIPMNFRDSSGNIPDFWIELFNKIGEEIPEGLPGTNPNDMFKSGFLRAVDYFLQ